MTLEKQIEAAAKRCRAAFAKYPDAKFAWCCHHKWFSEPLTEPAENRIQFILKNKAQSERVTRLNNFRPVRDEKKFKPLYDKYEADCKPLNDKYEADCKTLNDKYAADRKTLYDKYEADCKPLDDKYAADRKTLNDKYAADCKPLDDKYAADRKPLNDKYLADCKLLQKPLLKLYKQDVPLGTWNGKSIFKTTGTTSRK